MVQCSHITHTYSNGIFVLDCHLMMVRYHLVPIILLTEEGLPFDRILPFTLLSITPVLCRSMVVLGKILQWLAIAFCRLQQMVGMVCGWAFPHTCSEIPHSLDWGHKVPSYYGVPWGGIVRVLAYRSVKPSRRGLCTLPFLSLQKARWWLQLKARKMKLNYATRLQATGPVFHEHHVTRNIHFFQM